MKVNNDLLDSLSENKILIIDNNSNLNAEAINYLLIKGFGKIFLINPLKDIYEYFAHFCDISILFKVENINKIHSFKVADLCLIGFKPLANELFNVLKNHSLKKVVFFDNEIGAFQSLWKNKLKNIQIIEKGILSYASLFGNENLYYTEKLSPIRVEFFTNRGNQIKSFTIFTSSQNYSAAKIIGRYR